MEAQFQWQPLFWGSSIDFQFPAVKLLDFAESSDQLQTHDNIFAVIVLARLKCMETRNNPAERKAWKFRLVRSLFERGMDAGEIG